MTIQHQCKLLCISVIQLCLLKNYRTVDDYAEYLLKLIDETKEMLDKTFMTVETEEYRERRRQQAKEAERYTKENLIPK
ncbi:hypothetical protein ED551_07355 [Muribaculaceae bacterium Isolate-013 (NCI)]|nr:hypothetical protein ED551_07355 [Muribaculaceae bacterium Isolate-013 (NCI)]